MSGRDIYFNVHDDGSMTLGVRPQKALDAIPPGVYSLARLPSGEFCFRPEKPFSVPEHLYGDHDETCKRVLRTFADRPGVTTGVMMVGPKGNGKSLLAREICRRAIAELTVPVIIISSAYSGEDFNRFMRDIAQPCVFFVDEFEKVYESPHALGDLLSLMDGVGAGTKLWVLTANDTMQTQNGAQHAINQLRARPGRIWYWLDMTNVSQSTIEEYIKCNLASPALLEDTLAQVNVISTINFDVLKAIVEEVNRYNKVDKELLSILNVSNSKSVKLAYFARPGKPVGSEDDSEEEEEEEGPLKFHFNTSSVRVDKDGKATVVECYLDGMKRKYKKVTFRFPDHLTGRDSHDRVILTNEEGYRCLVLSD